MGWETGPDGKLIYVSGDGDGGGGDSGGGAVIGSGGITIDGVQYGINPETGNFERLSRGNDLSFAEQLQLRSTPSQSSSYNVSQSYQDPQSLALQQQGLNLDRDLGFANLAQDRDLTMANLQQEASLFSQQQNQQNQQFFASLTQDHNQFMQSLQMEQAGLNQRILESDRDYSIQLQNLNFLENKFAFESQYMAADHALRTQAEMFSQQATVAQMDMQRQSMIQDVRNLNVQMQAENQRFNAQMQFAVDQANQQAEEQRQDRLQSLARDISSAAQDPGDRGALASYILANQGESFDDVTDEDMRTEASMTPLDMLLQQREQAMIPQTPFGFDAQESPQVAEPEFGALPQVSDFQQAQIAPYSPTPFTPPPATPQVSLGGTYAANGAYYQPEAGAGAQYPQTPFGKTPQGQVPSQQQITSQPLGGTVQNDAGYQYTNYGTPNAAFSALSPDAYALLPDWVKQQTGAKYEEGGIATEPGYIVGEEGEEFVLKLGEGQDLIIPKDKVSAKQWNRLKQLSSAGMQEGGVFASIFGPSTPNTTLSKPFLDEAVQRAKSGTPWESGTLPGITFASTPGMDPIVTQLLASLNSLERGVPQEYFNRQAQRATPFSISPGIVRRSA
jgi:hypothetical protein